MCSFSFSVTPTKIASSCNVFLQYLGKCAFMKRAIKKQGYSLCCFCDFRK
ncbi:hypothetical protein T03_4832 [Trichinella britovi]|uniref:Uncharacterized protein n=1 Tax=Trichinella britovi TaxID=45882 RepID=A0A0V0ZHT7_TRIBR|nr:hypothetical protein T03_4832 [Trichinella britovi]